MTKPYSIILTTISSEAEAAGLAEMLVAEKLAACVQIMPISSIYTWQGAIQKDSEFLLLIKTTSDLYPRWKQLSSTTTVTRFQKLFRCQFHKVSPHIFPGLKKTPFK